MLADGVVVGRIMKAAAKPADASWLWTLAYGQHEDSTPTHAYEATREAAHSLRVGGGRRETERGIGSESMTAFPGLASALSPGGQVGDEAERRREDWAR